MLTARIKQFIVDIIFTIDRETMFTFSQAYKIVETERGTFRDWMDRGYIISSEDYEYRGRRVRGYNKNDLYAAGIFKHCLEVLTISREKSFYVAQSWHEKAHFDMQWLLFGWNANNEIAFVIEATSGAKRDLDQYLRSIAMAQTLLSFHTFILINFSKIRARIDSNIQASSEG